MYRQKNIDVSMVYSIIGVDVYVQGTFRESKSPDLYESLGLLLVRTSKFKVFLKVWILIAYSGSMVYSFICLGPEFYLLSINCAKCGNVK